MSTPATPPRLPPTPQSASTPRTAVNDQPQSPSTPKSASKRRLPKISLPSLSNFSLSSSPDTRVTLPPSPSSSGSTRRRKESGSSESEVSTTSVDLSDTPKPTHGAIEYPAIPSPRQDQPSRLSPASSQSEGLKNHGTESPSRNYVQNGMGRSRSLRTPTFMAPEEPLGRSTSIRSNRSSISISAALPSPLADFQSDNVLNASHRRVQYAHVSPHIQPSSAGPSSPVSRPMTTGRSSTSFHTLPPSHERYRLDLKDGHGVQNGGAAAVRSDTQVRGARTPTYAGNWNPFIPPGLDGWTREAWATRKVALISGITGQDGSYLTELLLSKGYTVHGIIRRSSSFNTSRLHHLYSDSHESEGEEERGRMILHYGDLTDTTNLVYIISQVQPSEIYNLGAQSHVKVSFEMAEYTGDVDGLGTLRLLDAVRTCGLDKLVKFYQASTSELYGKVREIPQNEDTPFYPRSPYGVAKLYAYWTVVNYREAYGIFAANGILFNHESPRRGRTFVTRKITRAVAEISLGKQDCMFMGNLDALRDWGHARDYVEGMWRILQHDEPRDFVLASGENHSVREFIEKSFAVVGVEIAWSGEGVDEVGVCKDSGRVVVRVDPRYFRPAEVEQLLGDPSLAEKLLGWSRQVSFDELVREMVESDVASAKYLVEDHN